jgi:hypothetical protein
MKCGVNLVLGWLGKYSEEHEVKSPHVDNNMIRRWQRHLPSRILLTERSQNQQNAVLCIPYLGRWREAVCKHSFIIRLCTQLLLVY